MLTEHISQEYKNDMFEFFYAFARFEYVMKVKGFSKKYANNNASPNWDKLKDDKEISEKIFNERTESGNRLLELAPMVQIIRMEGSNAVLAWQKVSYEVSRNNYFAQLMKALKTVRNNLFHGGKECESGFEYSDRNMDLIRTGTAVINEMVASLGWSGDFSAQH